MGNSQHVHKRGSDQIHLHDKKAFSLRHWQYTERSSKQDEIMPEHPSTSNAGKETSWFCSILIYSAHGLIHHNI